MIETTNTSSEQSQEFNIKNYVGVATLNVVAINPNNATLKKYGWNINDDAKEPVYTIETEKNGQKLKRCRVRLLCQNFDLTDKPIIPLDFWISEEYCINKDNTKAKIIDDFGNTGWASKEEIKNKEIPSYAKNKMTAPYRLCRVGEEELISFLIKYLGVPPYTIFDNKTQTYTINPKPSKIYFDNWNKLLTGDMRELADMISLQPNNKVKVILGVKYSDDNKARQTFIPSKFLKNGIGLENQIKVANKAIEEYLKVRDSSRYKFDSTTVYEYIEKPSTVEKPAVSAVDELFGGGGDNTAIPANDLPFDI